ncbi:uncharacterized protein LACBIDRAFT_310829 [Laccaria bicolor S238N-H82]|uniref:Predicted protein n=1 Tax=Laccaria bicolor (strain S238N-H82 / ATCC MYA-4686) TaxID=486041 RepID=B0DV63_LACBS|nr:uncharacterized protein LACBIDRAFT_310829 [Laccaria bicolor S238N-H82]EDR01524.1 predicted protein [Laccaria bicolor S238N-H82]|eukprot:XP_001887876.1 predicted protein [Laccaria bicolor S238N-H82]
MDGANSYLQHVHTRDPHMRSLLLPRESCSSLEESTAPCARTGSIWVPSLPQLSGVRHWHWFDIQTHSWNRIDTKVHPSARWCHQMALRKGFVIFFEGLMIQGLPEYKWRQLEFKETELKPSFVSPTPTIFTRDSLIAREVDSPSSPAPTASSSMEGKHPVGAMLEDTWILKFKKSRTQQ